MRKGISLRIKFLLASILGFFILLCIIFLIRIAVEFSNLRAQTVEQGWEYANLLGEIAEGLYLEESFANIQERLERGVEVTGVQGVVFDSEFEKNIAKVGIWEDFEAAERAIVPRDTVYFREEEVILQKFFDYSGTALWVKMDVDSSSIISDELKFLFSELIAVVIVAAVLTVILDRIAINPIKKVTVRLENIARGDADLSQRLNIDSHDEIGRLGRAFDKLMEQLQDLIKKIMYNANFIKDDMSNLGAVSQEINASSQQVVNSIQRISEGAQKQSQETENIFQGSSRISEFADQVYQSANEAQNIAEIVMKSSSTGEKAMSETIDKFSDISEVSENASQVVRQLSEKSRRIGTIVQTIRNISRQVNLLALNAAIEAAHAGEYGRGFEVVADEIRGLASQTSTATEEIAEIIEKIENTTIETVEYTEAVRDQLSQGEDAINQTNSVLQEIASETERSVSAIKNISNLASQQKELVETFVTALQGIVEIAEANAASSEEISASSQEQTASLQEITSNIQEVLHRANILSDLVEKFKV